MDLKLKGRRVLVTGSTRGIGYGIVRAFLAEGARVMLTGRGAGLIEQRCRTLRRKHGGSRVYGFAGDLTRDDVVRLLVSEVKRIWNGLDILVMNLGSGRSISGTDIPPEEWRRVLDLNLVSAVETLRQAVLLLEQGVRPTATFIGSIAGLESVGAPVAYGAAKAALVHTMKSMTALLAPRGIRVNLVAPGNILFRRGTWDRKLREDRENVEQMLQTQIPLQRFGTISEVASVVLFLASAQASFITGSCVVVDGGQTRSA
ncbi:MAG: SDR family oxidoreductase [Verrucomicrobiales bacterium]|nr:SDR family oxidoreductase [Verrucomicrobiales bacterium]